MLDCINRSIMWVSLAAPVYIPCLVLHAGQGENKHTIFSCSNATYLLFGYHGMYSSLSLNENNITKKTIYLKLL